MCFVLVLIVWLHASDSVALFVFALLLIVFLLASDSFALLDFVLVFERCFLDAN